MVPMDYYCSIAIDPADHLRGLLSSLIDTASAGGDNCLLFYYQDGPGRPPQRFIIFFPLLYDRLMVLIDYYLPIVMDLADLQVFIISVDRYRIGRG